MPDITFTQYLRPNGEKTTTVFNRSQEVADKAKLITDAGFRLECEVLRTNVVSFTIVGDIDGEPEDLDIALAPNGPGVGELLDQFLMGFNVDVALKEMNDAAVKS